MLSRRSCLVLLGSAAASCHPNLRSPTSAPPAPTPGRGAPLHDNPAAGSFELVDLSHSLGPGSPFIRVRDATFPFRRAPIATIEERGVYANRWELTEHIGTHIDAPCHFEASAACMDGVPVANLFAAVVLIDLEARAQTDADAELTPEDIEACEAEHGPLPERCAVLLRSGWDRRWPSQARFENADAAGVLHFPGFSPAAIERLARRPEVLGIGTDTFSIDPGRDARYEGHRVLARSGKWALECLAQLGRLPARGAQLFVGAPAVQAASGGPARVVAWVPRTKS